MGLDKNLLPRDRNNSPAIGGYDKENDEVKAVEVSEENRLKVEVKAGSPDGSGRVALNSGYGDKMSATRKPSLSASFFYPLESNDAIPDLVGTGNVVQEDAVLKVQTGASSSSSATITSVDFLRYIPGHEAYIIPDIKFTTPKVWSTQFVGLFDDDDGFCFWYDELNFHICRKRNGITTCLNIDLSIPIDLLGTLLDPSNWNTYRLTYAFGYGPAHLEVQTGTGAWFEIWHIIYNNENTETNIEQTRLPLRAEVVNTTNDTNIEIHIASVSAGVIDGSIEPGTVTDPTARFFTKEAPLKTALTGVAIAFRNKTTYAGLENRVSALLKLVTSANEWNKPVSFRLLKQPDFDSATWADINTADSTLEFSTDLVLTAGAEDGETFLNWTGAKSDNFFEDVTDQNLLLPPGGVAVFYFETTSSATDVLLAIRWAELF